MDSNPGTAELPLRTINAGIEAADASGLPAVYVAEGTYDATYDAGLQVVMTEGIGVYGGFSGEDWSVRDPSSYPTQLVDASTSVPPAGQTPSRAVEFLGELSSDTILDGVSVSAGDTGACVFVSGGGPVVRDSVLVADHGQTGLGVYITGGQPLVEGNRMWVGNANVSRGVRCEDAQPQLLRNEIVVEASPQILAVAYDACGGVIAHNTIVAGTPDPTLFSRSNSIVLSGSSPEIRSNTLVAHEAATANDPWGVHIWVSGNSSALNITNNNFVQPTPGVMCVRTQWVDYPATFHNNNVTCEIIYHAAVAGNYTYSSVSVLEAALPDASENVVLGPAVQDADAGDWRTATDGSAPCGLTRGGLQLGNELDIDGNPRTPPWSIGAYEVDGPCF